MNIIKNGDPRKIEEHNRHRAFRVFNCPVCGCVWEASIAPGTTEARPPSYLSAMDGYDGWYSDCPMTDCTGVGIEMKE